MPKQNKAAISGCSGPEQLLQAAPHYNGAAGYLPTDILGCGGCARQCRASTQHVKNQQTCIGIYTSSKPARPQQAPLQLRCIKTTAQRPCPLPGKKVLTKLPDGQAPKPRAASHRDAQQSHDNRGTFRCHVAWLCPRLSLLCDCRQPYQPTPEHPASHIAPLLSAAPRLSVPVMGYLDYLASRIVPLFATISWSRDYRTSQELHNCRRSNCASRLIHAYPDLDNEIRCHRR